MWKTPTQALTKYQISAQAWTKSLERKMLPTAGDRQDFYTKCLFSDLLQRFVHAYFGHFLALFDTLSTLALDPHQINKNQGTDQVQTQGRSVKCR